MIKKSSGNIKKLKGIRNAILLILGDITLKILRSHFTYSIKSNLVFFNSEILFSYFYS